MAPTYIRWFEDIGTGDVASVGGKNASLGEMVRNLGCHGIKVPPGFAITADGYRQFLKANDLCPLIASRFAELAAGRLPSPKPERRSEPRIQKGAWPEDSPAPSAKPTGIFRSASEWPKLT